MLTDHLIGREVAPPTHIRDSTSKLQVECIGYSVMDGIPPGFFHHGKTKYCLLRTRMRACEFVIVIVFPPINWLSIMNVCVCVGRKIQPKNFRTALACSISLKVRFHSKSSQHLRVEKSE